MSRSQDKRLKAQGATRLGVPKDLLLKAMEICPTVLHSNATNMDWKLTFGLDAFWVVSNFKEVEIYDARASDHLEHTIREWLGKHSCEVRFCNGKTVVYDRNDCQASYNPHYLTALCMAAVEIGGNDEVS